MDPLAQSGSAQSRTATARLNATVSPCSALTYSGAGDLLVAVIAMPSAPRSRHRRNPQVGLLAALFLAIAASVASAAPWRSVGPEGAPFSSLVIRNGSSGSLYATIRDRGLFRSDDGGRQWQELANSPFPALRVAIEPSTAALALATNSQVHFSTDGGGRWLLTRLAGADSIAIGPGQPAAIYGARGTSAQRVIGEGAPVAITAGLEGARVRTLRLDPSRPTRLFAGTDDGLFLSTNRGDTWTRLGSDLLEQDVVAVTADPRQANRLFVGTNGAGVWRSTDTGATWVQINDGLSDLRVRDVAVDTVTAGRVWAASEDGIFVSLDHGTSWSRADLEPRAPIVAVVAGPAAGLAYVATDTGLARSDDSGASWQPANGGLHMTTVPSVRQRTGSAREVVAGTTGGVFVSFDAGGMWSGLNEGLRSPQVQDLAVVGERIFAATSGGAWVLPSLGQSWTRLNGITNPVVAAIAVDGATPDRLYAATAGGGVFRSLDAGTTWRSANSGLSNLFVSRLAAVPGRAGEIYALAANQVVVSRNGGDNWGATAALTSGSVSALAVSPHAPDTLFVATANGIQRTTDGGLTWTESGLLGLHVDSVLASERRPGLVYAGLRGGSVRVSFDDGASWQRLGGAGPLGSVLGLAEVATEGTLVYAATREAGVWVAQQVCGDGELDAGETCDDAGAGACPAGCGTPTRCTGDCDSSGDVTVDEIVRGVSIALGLGAVAECSPIDRNGDRVVTVDEIIAAVRNALSGCSDEAAAS